MARCMILDYSISDESKKRAGCRADMVQFGRKSYSKFGSERHRTLVGYLGEEMIKEYLGIEALSDNYDFDLNYRDFRVEVKTVSCKFKPHPDYLCTVNSHNLHGIHKQAADYYVFTRIVNDLSRGWILGFIKCADFFEKGKFVSKGSSVIPGVKFWKANATVLPISELTSIEFIHQI